MARSLNKISSFLNSRKAGRFQLYQGLKRRRYHDRYPLKYDIYNDAADYQLGPVLLTEGKTLSIVTQSTLGINL